MDSLQSLMGSTSLVCTILNFQLAMALAVESVADRVDRLEAEYRQAKEELLAKMV